ncbi:MAG: hypothetical protein ACXWNK_16235 [Vulcanimicrobiaceae bacterium]
MERRKKAREAYGGVSARKRRRVLYGVQVVKAQAASAGGAFPNFVNNGGPVVTTPRIYTSFWGALWSDAPHASDVARLNAFCADLLNSNFMNVLAQYGSGNGPDSSGVIASSTFATVANQLANADIESTIQAAIDAGTIPEPPANNTSNVLIIYLDENTEVNDSGLGVVMCEPSGDTAFGYHDFFTTAKGNPFYYAVVPALDDNCLHESCPGGDGTCSLHLTETQEQRRTQVTSHEFAEMVTDPELNAWYDPQNGENGDICNGESDTIAVGANTWTVQRIYSKYDDVKTNGATYCLAQAPSPEPRQ